jgi:hypothetical protein
MSKFNQREIMKKRRFNKTASAKAVGNFVTLEKEYEDRMADLAGKPSTSLAQRAWAVEREWRRAKKLDVKLHSAQARIPAG